MVYLTCAESAWDLPCPPSSFAPVLGLIRVRSHSLRSLAHSSTPLVRRAMALTRYTLLRSFSTRPTRSFERRRDRLPELRPRQRVQRSGRVDCLLNVRCKVIHVWWIKHDAPLVLALSHRLFLRRFEQQAALLGGEILRGQLGRVQRMRRRFALLCRYRQCVCELPSRIIYFGEHQDHAVQVQQVHARQHMLGLLHPHPLRPGNLRCHERRNQVPQLR